jgi:hypothetical protein
MITDQNPLPQLPICGYTVKKRLGAGTFGDVYIVEANGTEYAMKHFKVEELVGGIDIISLAELDILSRVNHYN